MAHKVRIKNIHKWIYEEEISKAFTAQLGLNPVKVKIETYGPKSLEKGWAEFNSEEERQKALQLSGFIMRDQPLEISLYEPEANKKEKITKQKNIKVDPTSDPSIATPQNAEAQQEAALPKKEKVKPKNKPKSPRVTKIPVPTNNPSTPQATDSTPVTFTTSTSSTPATTSQIPPTKPTNLPNNANRPKKGAKAEAPVYQEEFERVKAKYKTFTVKSSHPLVASLSLPPSDPDFPFDLKGLLLHITIPPTYPTVPCVIKVMNPDSEVSEKLKKKIEAAVLKRAQVAYNGKPMIAGLLFWLDRNMESLLVDKQITEDFNLAKMGIQLVVNKTFQPAPREITTNPDQPPLDLPPPPTQTTTTTTQQEEPTEPKPEEEKPSEITPTITTALKGTRIKFDEMSFVNVGILECVLLNVTVTCEKCRSRMDALNIIKGAQISEECEKCKNPYSVGFRPEIMHEYSNIMGYLDLDGCAIFDLLPSSFKAACFECNAAMLFKDTQYSETKTEKNCMQCHQKIAISLSRPSFTKMKAKKPVVILDPAELEEKKKKKKRDPNDLLIKPGQPLPHQGTCKHYKHSFRWLRFPCCGKAFPCDICHETQTDGHEAKWANRMICGFCCREQAWSQKPCVACGGDVTGSIQTKFWEGGEGQRDKSKMSNKDSHKFKNSVLKTQSKKATRVGPKKE